MNKNNVWERVAALCRLLVPWLLVLTAVGLVGYYIFFPSWGYFHSDCTDTLMWAQASADGGSLFNPDFHYACLLPFGGQLLMLPFVALFGVSTLTQSLGMLLFLLLFTAALIGLCRAMDWSWGWTSVMVAALLLTLSASDKLREIFWGHIIYYSLGILFLIVGLMLVLLVLRAGDPNDAVPPNALSRRQDMNDKQVRLRYWILLGLSLLWFFLCSLNGLQALTVFALPMLAALAGERYFDTTAGFRTERTLRTARLTLLLFAAVCLGYVAGTWVTRNFQQGYFDAYSGFTSSDKWIENLTNLLPNWLTLLGVNVKQGDPLTNGAGIVNLLRIGVGLILLIVPIAATCCYRRIQERPLRMMLLAHWGLTALLLMANVFGMLANANWRLSPLVASCLLVTVMFSRWLWTQRPLRRFTLLTLAPVLLLCTVVALNLAQMPADYGQSTGLPAVARYLEEKDLTYGYATFWNANAVTVLSDSKVKIRDVDIDKQGCRPRLYQSNDHWYEVQPGQDRYFLLLTSWEYTNIGGKDNPLLTTAVEE